MKTTVNLSEYLKEKNAGRNTGAHYDAFAARKKNVLGSKIAKARKDRGMNQQQLTDLLNKYGVNIQKAALSKWENGDNAPNGYQLIAICVALNIEDGFSYFSGNINLNPIQADTIEEKLNPAGRKMLAQYADLLISSGKYSPAPADEPFIICRDMPVYDLGVSAGPGQFLDDALAEMKSFPADSIPEDADFAVRVAGTSMEPVFNDGQYVWVQKCERLENGEVGIFEWNGDSYIKVYREKMPDPDFDPEDIADEKQLADYMESITDSEGVIRPEVMLISYNTADGTNPPKVIRPGDTFHIFGRVLKV